MAEPLKPRDAYQQAAEASAEIDDLLDSIQPTKSSLPDLTEALDYLKAAIRALQNSRKS